MMGGMSEWPPRADDLGREIVALGMRVRRARARTGLTQSAVAERTGIQQSTISRMELGDGGGVALRTWLAVGEAVGTPLFQPDRPRASSAAGTLCGIAQAGGWFVVGRDPAIRLEREAQPLPPRFGPGSVRIVPARVRPPERLVVVLADVMTRVDPWVELLVDAVHAERSVWDGRVGGLLVARDDVGTRRLNDQIVEVRHTFPAGWAWTWCRALEDPAQEMPRVFGLVGLSARAGSCRPLRGLS